MNFKRINEEVVVEEHHEVGRTYHTRDMLTDGNGSCTFHSDAERGEGGEKACKLYLSLSKVLGVVDVSVRKHAVFIKRCPAYEWEEIESVIVPMLTFES